MFYICKGLQFIGLIIIDPERRLMKAYEGTEWQPEKAEKDIRNLLEAYNF